MIELRFSTKFNAEPSKRKDWRPLERARNIALWVRHPEQFVIKQLLIGDHHFTVVAEYYPLRPRRKQCHKYEIRFRKDQIIDPLVLGYHDKELVLELFNDAACRYKLYGKIPRRFIYPDIKIIKRWYDRKSIRPCTHILFEFKGKQYTLSRTQSKPPTFSLHKGDGQMIQVNGNDAWGTTFTWNQAWTRARAVITLISPPMIHREGKEEVK